MTRQLRPFIGDTVFELSAGIGNITARLMGRRLRYIAAERDPLYLHALRNRFLRTPNVQVARVDPNNDSDFEPWRNSFETALCLNVLEFANDPVGVVRSLYSVLVPGGSMVVLVPQTPGLFGSVDETLGHKRRFSE